MEISIMNYFYKALIQNPINFLLKSILIKLIIISFRLIFILNKYGFIVPCTLTTKILPNLSEGLQIIGFIKSMENKNISIDTD